MTQMAVLFLTLTVLLVAVAYLAIQSLMRRHDDLADAMQDHSNLIADLTLALGIAEQQLDMLQRQFRALESPPVGDDS